MKRLFPKLHKLLHFHVSIFDLFEPPPLPQSASLPWYYRVATLESIQNSLTFPWQNYSFPWQFLLLFNLWKNNFQLLLSAIPPTHLGFLKGKSLTVIISRLWVYICPVDIYINTTQAEPLPYDGSFNLKIMSWQNSLTWFKWPKFPDIWHFFQNSPTWRKFCFSLTFPWHVATLTCNTVLLSFEREFNEQNVFTFSFQLPVLIVPLSFFPSVPSASALPVSAASPEKISQS